MKYKEFTPKHTLKTRYILVHKCAFPNSNQRLYETTIKKQLVKCLDMSGAALTRSTEESKVQFRNSRAIDPSFNTTFRSSVRRSPLPPFPFLSGVVHLCEYLHAFLYTCGAALKTMPATRPSLVSNTARCVSMHI